jgi:hypothetical protein
VPVDVLMGAIRQCHDLADRRGVFALLIQLGNPVTRGRELSYSTGSGSASASRPPPRSIKQAQRLAI